jgi:hypothetical protein
MGCHTWFKLPVITGKEEVKKHILKIIDKQRNEEWWDDTVEAQALMDIEYLNQFNYEDMVWYTYNENLSFRVVNGVPGLYTSYYDDSDEPRIGGYPEAIATSYEEMMGFMESGLKGEDGRHYDFYIEDDRRDRIINHIKTFFEKHPDGIITFG